MTEEKKERSPYLGALYNLNGQGLPESLMPLFHKWKAGNDETIALLRQQQELESQLAALERRKLQLSGQNAALAELLYDASTEEEREALMQQFKAEAQPEEPTSEEKLDIQPPGEGAEAPQA